MPIEIDGETYYSVNEACGYLGITRDTLYRRINEGRLQKYTHGAKNRTYFLLKDLAALRTPRPATNHGSKDE
jgi:excisionase family DNA binding protein